MNVIETIVGVEMVVRGISTCPTMTIGLDVDAVVWSIRFGIRSVGFWMVVEGMIRDVARVMLVGIPTVEQVVVGVGQQDMTTRIVTMGTTADAMEGAGGVRGVEGADAMTITERMNLTNG